ncbi:MAG: intermembrane transport protein PqiB [Akkermansiaceae bacterium]|nr:intermembrane transport protein PqiB [Akkermansiaceae bacterium]MDP4646955.1 intermembrane transport protein PqiB [Akkermansiaceae bacterium]MDP4720622.1 intermembrane transport protein PqiB [Akkermansiaceae bacterium]MDP4780186.1 intermembrane transport protein PqiB [Akkermansiaceae bacterium]MDP4847566.1 intermembrane transport protein PqiB [Akkermansiaceae bacterium]
MSESEPTASKPELKAAQRWNIVWVVPILAIFIGGWMLWKNISSEGAEIQIRFETADGISAGKTEIKCRSVTVGKVTRVELSEDLQSVEIQCRMDDGTDNLLRKGTRFWVVRPRVSAADVSGLGTLLTGVYIELDPGTGDLGPRKWKGRETPPSTSSSVPGLRMTLVTDEAGSLSVGAPIYYRGFEVGRIESRKLDPERRRITYSAFIGEEYQELVRNNTKFWNTSGIDVSAGVDGFKLRTPSFQAMVSGGVSFALLEGDEAGPQALDGSVFELHEDADSAASSTFEPTFELLLLFDQSIRGLRISAPVEYRGIVIGRVKSISFDYATDRESHKIPVLVEIDPSALRPSGTLVPEEDELPILADAIEKGLRATLKTGSYLTGAMFVDFDYYPEEKKEVLAYNENYPLLPTLVSGLAQIEVKLASIMETIDALPLEETVTNISTAAEESKKALAQIEGAAAAARETMENPEFKALPADVRASLAALDKSVTSMGPDGNIQGDLLRTLDELRNAIRSMESMTDTIKDDPNSLLFGKDDSVNPRPKAAGRR